MMTTTMPLLSLTGVTPQSPHHADDASCPVTVADLFRLCGINPAEVGGDWLDLLDMVGTLADGSAASDRRC